MGSWSAEYEGRSVAAPETVWVLWADPSQWSRWNRDIASAELLGPFAISTAARVRFRVAPGPQRFVITEVEFPHRFVIEGRLPGALLGHEHVVEPRERGGSTIRHRLYLDGPLAGMWAALLGRRFRRALPAFIEAERRLADARGGGGPGKREPPRHGWRRPPEG